MAEPFVWRYRAPVADLKQIDLTSLGDDYDWLELGEGEQYEIYPGATLIGPGRVLVPHRPAD